MRDKLTIKHEQELAKMKKDLEEHRNPTHFGPAFNQPPVETKATEVLRKEGEKIRYGIRRSGWGGSVRIGLVENQRRRICPPVHSPSL